VEPFLDLNDAKMAASKMAAELQALHVHNTSNERAVRRKYSHKIRQASAEFVIELALELLNKHGIRWQAYELIAAHPAAFRRMHKAELETFGRGIDSWWSVDTFARLLAGPAWLKGQVSDELIHDWTQSEERWWRRAALVSTVALNVRSKGGRGDAPRTLAVCSLLADDHDDMVAKAMSWALRELVSHDRAAVYKFLDEHETVLAARVKREVRNKLETGLKNPKGRAKEV
jgi:3-methyladenine DNA glycosylase AlkD